MLKIGMDTMSNVLEILSKYKMIMGNLRSNSFNGPIEKTAKIIINSYNKSTLDAYCELAKRVFMDGKASHVSIQNQAMKVKKWTVLSSPHVHKTSRDQFERRIHTSIVSIYDMMDQNILRLVWYLRLHTPTDTKIRVLIKKQG